VSATTLVQGRSVTVRVPASSANLGPGFDCLGLALGLHDEVTVTIGAPGVRVTVEGEGAGAVPTDATHLVVRAVVSGLQAAGAISDGAPVPGLDVHCRNAIPHSRGLGSSASAVVCGLRAGVALAGVELVDEVLVQRSSEYEGHPDNAAASVLGGAVVAWTEIGPSGPRYRAERIEVHPEIVPVVLVPTEQSSTEATRGMLPARVRHADAAFNAGRSALAVLALTTRPELLLPATEDRLHQAQRAPAMPTTATLVARLRAAGVAAVVSGAGPSVLALTLGGLEEVLCGVARSHGWSVLELPVADGVALL
jgi:homoserine kinase